MPKRYRVIWNREKRLTTIPGKYAGSRGVKIFGRMDCWSGRQRIHPTNRVFFHDWEDAIEAGYRPCRICKPNEPRMDEHLSAFHPAMSRLHVAIFETSPGPYPKKPSVCFYVTLHWDKACRGGRCSSQLDLEDWFPYPIAIAKAIVWGKKLGLPVIDHFWRADGRVRYLSPSVTPEQRREQKKLLASREVKQLVCAPLA